VPRDERPEPVALGPVGSALVHQAGRPVRERTVDEIGVSGDPPHVGRAPEDVALLEIEDVLHRARRADEIAARRVHDPLRLSRRARRVEDEEHILGIHHLGFAFVVRMLHEPVVPVVAPLDHVHMCFPDGPRGAALHHDHVLDRRALLERLVGVALERDDLAATVPAVGGDHDLRLRIVHPVAQRLGAEAAEDHRMHRADPGAGEHRDGGLGDEREIDADAVTLLDAEGLEDVREGPDLTRELPIGERAAVAGLALPDDRRLVAPRAE
jgi:hypothetical protein